MGSLDFRTKRYSEIERDIPKINLGMLSKELKDLEANRLVVQKVYDAIPLTLNMN
ncbi:winged helix-turn-helix transcriptional regulator [Chryseobacterium jejuense]|uniref:winged helix-turn-helix transcriptional regulator n=1 Tax=Chryseobacterium jejuense TaxID=445960 RepID=UPI001AE5AD59